VRSPKLWADPDKQQRAEAKSDDAKRKLLQYRCAERRVFAAQAEMRLNAHLPRVKILLHFAT
jgi:hypothetical protein